MKLTNLQRAVALSQLNAGRSFDDVAQNLQSVQAQFIDF